MKTKQNGSITLSRCCLTPYCPASPLHLPPRDRWHLPVAPETDADTEMQHADNSRCHAPQVSHGFTHAKQRRVPLANLQAAEKREVQAAIKVCRAHMGQFRGSVSGWAGSFEQQMSLLLSRIYDQSAQFGADFISVDKDTRL